MKAIIKVLILCVILGGLALQGQERKSPSGRAPVPRSGPSIPRGTAPRMPQSPRVPRVAPIPRVAPRVPRSTVPRSTIPRAVEPRGSDREPGLRPIPRGGVRPFPSPRIRPLPRLPIPRIGPHVQRNPSPPYYGGHSGGGRPEHGRGYGIPGPHRHYSGRHIYPGLHGGFSYSPYLYHFRWVLKALEHSVYLLPLGGRHIYCGVILSYEVRDGFIIIRFITGERLILVPIGGSIEYSILESIVESQGSGELICLECE